MALYQCAFGENTSFVRLLFIGGNGGAGDSLTSGSSLATVGFLEERAFLVSFLWVYSESSVSPVFCPSTFFDFLLFALSD